MAGTILGKRTRASVDSRDGACSIAAKHPKRRDCAGVKTHKKHEIIEVAQDNVLMQLDTPKSKGSRDGEMFIGKDESDESAPSSRDTDENAPARITTPQTSRHHNVLAFKFPVTPKHRVLVTGRPLTPRTPRTPSTSSTSSATVYNHARKVFTRSADPGLLVGRKRERTELQDFITKHVAAETGGCLYVSGPPGTGKSALVTEICGLLKWKASIRCAYVNCMSIKNASSIYSLTASELELSDDVLETGAKDALQAAVLDKEASQMLLIVLDEIDQLLGLDTDVLYTLFEWSFSRNSKLILIGIANALDLTDRFLPRLKARNLKPTLLPFLPYTVAETASVLTARARSLLPKDNTAAADFTPFLHPAAIQLISKKVASQSGDLRKAFDIAQRAIDIVEQETREKLAKEAETEQQASPISPSRIPLSENPNFSSPSTIKIDSPSRTPREDRPASTHILLAQLSVESAPRATLAHVIRVTSAAFNNGASQRLKALTLQQKAVLCSLVSLEQQRRDTAASLPSPPLPSGRKGSKILTTPTSVERNGPAPAAAPTMQELFDMYSLLCKRDNVLHVLSNTEFRDVVANLETLSLVASADGAGNGGAAFAGLVVTPTKRGRAGVGGFVGKMVDQRRLKAFVGIKDLEVAVEGVGSGILKAMLHGAGFD